MLVEEDALVRAEQECLADQDARERRQLREALRREDVDRDYVDRFAARIREVLPQCPSGRERRIALHACRKYSGRVGRSAAAKAFDEEAIRSAVVAHIRHAETSYDELLMSGYERAEARDAVRAEVDRILYTWQTLS